MRRKILKYVVGAASAAVMGYLGLTGWQVWDAGRHASSVGLEGYDAIVVLGAAQYDGRPSPVLRRRLDHAHELWMAGVAPRVVVTGGKRSGDRFTEGYAGFVYLRRLGIPEDDLIVEDRGTNTWEQLAAAARILGERDMTQVVLVSDAYHSYRLAQTATELGLEAAVSPSAGSVPAEKLVRETLAVAVGRIIGYGRLERLGQRSGVDERLMG